MSKFKVGDKVIFNICKYNAEMPELETTTTLDLLLPQIVVDVDHEDSFGYEIKLEGDEDFWAADYFEAFVESPQERLYAIAKAFIKDQHILCEDDIYQSDRVIENAYQFIAEVFAIVGSKND